MKNYNIILTEKQQKYQHIIRKTDKYEYLAGEDILLSDQGRMIEQAKFVHSF